LGEIYIDKSCAIGLRGLETSKEAFKAQVWLFSEYVGGLREADFVDAEFGVVAFQE
jgi:hypothetical protein